jgi:hypothetical protein
MKRQSNQPRKPASKFAHLKQKQTRNKLASNVLKQQKQLEKKRK